MTDKVDLARQTLKAGDEFRQAALDADRVLSRENGKVTPLALTAITSLLRKASTLDKVSEKLAGSVLGDR